MDILVINPKNVTFNHKIFKWRNNIIINSLLSYFRNFIYPLIVLTSVKNLYKLTKLKVLSFTFFKMSLSFWKWPFLVKALSFRFGFKQISYLHLPYLRLLCIITLRSSPLLLSQTPSWPCFVHRYSFWIRDIKWWYWVSITCCIIHFKPSNSILKIVFQQF